MLGAGLYGVLVAEAKFARRMIGNATDTPPDATGWYGRGRPAPAIRIALLGYSSAAGYGCERVEETPGALLASGVAERADRRVYLREFAVVGAESRDLSEQVDRTLPIEADLAVILIGANDVTNPAARNDPSSPIHGMPILNVDQSKSVIVLKRSMSSGFAGIENPLFFAEGTSMLFGDAKKSVSEVTEELKAL